MSFFNFKYTIEESVLNPYFQKELEMLYYKCLLIYLLLSSNHLFKNLINFWNWYKLNNRYVHLRKNSG